MSHDRARIVSRPGLDKYAGPPPRELVKARWLPIFVPLALQIATVAGIHRPDLFFLVTAIVLLMSARAFRETGTGLGLLVMLQLFAAGLTTVLLLFNLFSPQDWLRFSGSTGLLMGYVSFVFNLVGSYLPR